MHHSFRNRLMRPPASWLEEKRHPIGYSRGGPSVLSQRFGDRYSERFRHRCTAGFSAPRTRPKATRYLQPESAPSQAVRCYDPLVRYSEFAPNASLASIVARLWVLEGDQSELSSAEQPVLPDGCPELILHFGDDFLRVHDDGREEQQAKTLFAG